MKRKLSVKNCFIALIYVVALITGIWIIASFIDTNLHNMPSYEDYQDFAEWNLFAMVDWTEMSKS